MNKRVVTFLSLFSLVMVLSVYYVMLPSGVTSPGGSSSPVTNVITNADDPYIEGIILERKTSLQEDIEFQLDIMASSEYSATEKALAAERIEYLENIINVEEDMRTSVKERGFVSAFVEIKDKSIDVLALSETKTKAEAMMIIDCIDSFFIDGMFRQVYVHFR
ncbi:MAG: SpoIIIAH-like family protein [Erysipelotrichales bacterium]|nr:SpoIIIAH-like family protein [Erysipelotrichales bacterium]